MHVCLMMMVQLNDLLVQGHRLRAVDVLAFTPSKSRHTRCELYHFLLLQVSVSLFLPPGLTHHVCIAYPILSTNSETNELKLIPTRKRLHAALGLPHNQPMLRAANSISDDPWVGLGGAAEAASSGSAKAAVLRLRDVHVTLPAPGKPHDTKLVLQIKRLAPLVS